MLTKEKDYLQLFDPPMIEQILSLDAEATWQFVLSNVERLKALESRDSPVMHAYPQGPERFRKMFFYFYEEDEQCVKQGLINDLAFIGERVPMNFWARCGYLDHPSSATVMTSRDLIPEWDEGSDAEAFSALFHVLDAGHVNLMTASMKTHRDQLDPECYVDQLKIDIIAKACCQNPTFRAAYIYA